MDLGIYPVEPSLIYRLLEDHQEEMPIAKMSPQEIEQLDASPLTILCTKEALCQVSNKQVVQVLMTDEQAEQLEQLCLADILEKERSEFRLQLTAILI